MSENSAEITSPTDHEPIIARNEFGVYSIPASGAYRPAASTTITGAVWEKETINFIRKYANTRDIIHAGAFFGDFLPPLSAALQGDARIWAFEPNSLSFRHAQHTIALNGIENVELRMAGLGEISGIRRRPEGLSLGGGNSFVESRDTSVKDSEIVRIDDAIPADRDVGIVHLNLDGYELRALRGALETIRRCRPIVIIVANKPTPRCTRLLAPLKYRIVGVVNGNLVLRPAEMAVALEEGETTSPTDDESIIARNEYGIYSIPASSAYRPAASTTITGAVWEKETIAFIRKYAGAKDIIHAGAFFGDFLPPLSAALRGDARIWAFEPSPLNFRHAQHTIALNGIENVELRMAGLGATSRMRGLLIKGPEGLYLGGGSRFVKGHDASVKGETVDAEIVRIDDAVPADRDVGIIQLDLEGYELNALRGALATIGRCRPIVIIEANNPTPRCVKLLAPLEYTIVGMMNRNLVLRPAEMAIELEVPAVVANATAAIDRRVPAAGSVPVVVAAPPSGCAPGAIEIEINGSVVRASPGVDVALLGEVIRLLKAVPG
jgi:FkbM family methyltransferase